MRLPPAIDLFRSSNPWLFRWTMLSLLLNLVFVVLMFNRGEGTGKQDTTEPQKGRPVATAPGKAHPKAKSRPEKNRPEPAPTISWEAYRMLAVEPERPVLPEFQGWLTTQARALNVPGKKFNDLMQAAANADSAYTRAEHESMSPGANGAWTVRISPAQMKSVIKTLEENLGKVLEPEVTRALVEVAEGWVPKGKNIEYAMTADIDAKGVNMRRTLPETGQKLQPTGMTIESALEPNGYWNKWMQAHFPQLLRELQAAQEKK